MAGRGRHGKHGPVSVVGRRVCRRQPARRSSRPDAGRCGPGPLLDAGTPAVWLQAQGLLSERHRHLRSGVRGSESGSEHPARLTTSVQHRSTLSRPWGAPRARAVMRRAVRAVQHSRLRGGRHGSSAPVAPHVPMRGRSPAPVGWMSDEGAWRARTGDRDATNGRSRRRNVARLLRTRRDPVAGVRPAILVV